MPTLNIEGHSVNVDDSFLKLSPDEQNATVDEIHQSLTAGTPQAAPIGDNRAATVVNLRGLPLVGGYADKGTAYLNALAAKAGIDPGEGMAKSGTISEMAAANEPIIKAAADQREKEHPIESMVGKMAAGTGALAPLGATALGAKALGLTGSLPGMMVRGAASGAALGGADAAARGEDVVQGMGFGAGGGIVGPLIGRAVGKTVSAISDRVRPSPVVPRNLANVGGVEIPLSESQVTQNPATSAEEQILLRGGRGEPAQSTAQGFKDLQDSRVNDARNTVAASLDPTGRSATTAPQDAAEKIASELIAKEQVQQAAQAGVTAGPMSPAQQGSDLARSLGGGQLRAASPFDAGEVLSDRLAAARNAAQADYRGKYNAVAEQPGEFAPGSAAGFRGDVENGLRSGENPVDLDATNTPKSLQALSIIDKHLNLAGPASPKPVEAAADLGPQHAQNVADIRARFGNDVATAYDRQKATAAAPLAPTAPSLLEFLASKGGLGPDSELEAIGAHNHTVNVDGLGRRKLVKQGGFPLDYAREAAEESGYLRGENGSTSTPRDFLDAIDAEIRGQKRYPEGFEGQVNKREAAAMSEREQAEHDRHMQGFEDDLTAAGHGELGPDIKQRAVKLMANEGHDADTAVEHALHQLEQEDALHGAGFPGDSSAAAASTEPRGAGFTMRNVEQVRKQLSSLYGDARRSMMAGGSGADLRAIEHITDQFDARVKQMVADGKFSGDGPAVLKMQEAARASFADYKQKFSRRGSGDTVGAAVEKILGKFSDTKATPDEVVKLAYGSPSAPGGQMPVQIAQRIATIFGKNSPEFATYKQGLFHHLTAVQPEEAASRINDFLTGTKGRLLAQTVFEPSERKSMAQYATRLSGLLPKPSEPGAVAAAIRRYTGADGGPPASTNQIVNDLFGATGKGAGRIAAPLAAHLKPVLSPESWTALRQGMFEKLTNAGEGKVPFEAQALSQRLHEFLNESGGQLAKVLYSPQERKLMGELAGVYKQMIPVKGTTNPSGTAPMLAKIASGTRHTLLPLLGFSHGGVPGAAVAVGIDKALTSLSNAKAARSATKLFYGAQPRRAVDPRFARAGGLAAQVIGGSATGDRATAPPAPLALSPPPIRQMTPGARR